MCWNGCELVGWWTYNLGTIVMKGFSQPMWSSNIGERSSFSNHVHRNSRSASQCLTLRKYDLLDWSYIFFLKYRIIHHQSRRKRGFLKAFEGICLWESFLWKFRGVDQYALLVAALCHDIGHQGRTNPFLAGELRNYVDLATFEASSILHHFRWLRGIEGFAQVWNLFVSSPAPDVS